MAKVAPLAMSQTKEDLLEALGLPLDAYNLMAKEVDRVYRDLTSSKQNLKRNCTRKPPYDWSDIVEIAKDDAMRDIARNGDAYTRYYWNLAVETTECPNWIARWFLYHKFRYRDGRNRNLAKGTSSRGPKRDRWDTAAGNQDGHGYDEAFGEASYEQYYEQTYDYSAETPSSTSHGSYITASRVYSTNRSDAQTAGTYYDPVRDINV